MQNDIFVLLEAHVESKDISKFDKRVQGFDTIWKPATRIYSYGRGIGGYVCGVRKDIAGNDVVYDFKRYGNVDALYVKIGKINFSIVPTYIRGNNWLREFEELRYCRDGERYESNNYGWHKGKDW